MLQSQRNGNIRVQSRQTAIERHQSALVMARQGCKIRIGHLAVADDALPGDGVVTQRVAPEVMSGVADDALQNVKRCSHVECFQSQEQAHQGALRDGAGGKRCGMRCEPSLGDCMVNVSAADQRHQNIAVEKARGSGLCSACRSLFTGRYALTLQKSSSSAFTSSGVNTRFGSINGRPVTGLRLMLPRAAALSVRPAGAAKPRCINSTAVALRLRRVCSAKELTTR